MQSACDALTGLGSARGASAAAYPSCACASRLVTLCLLLLGRGLRLGWSRPWPVARCLAGPESVLWPRASVAGFALRRRRGLVATASASSRCRVGSCGACMCWCMRSTCEVSYVQGAVMGARLTCVGLSSLEPGRYGDSVMQCGDAWSMGSARKAGAWAGRCGWGWSAGLVVHERLGQTSCVSRLSVSTQPPCNTPFPQRRRYHFITPSSSLDFRGLRWQGRFNQGRMADYHLASP